MRHTPCMGRAQAKASKRRRAGRGPGPCRRFGAWARARPMQGVCLIKHFIYIYIYIYIFIYYRILVNSIEYYRILSNIIQYIIKY